MPFLLPTILLNCSLPNTNLNRKSSSQVTKLLLPNNHLIVNVPRVCFCNTVTRDRVWHCWNVYDGNNCPSVFQHWSLISIRLTDPTSPFLFINSWNSTFLQNSLPFKLTNSFTSLMIRMCIKQLIYKSPWTLLFNTSITSFLSHATSPALSPLTLPQSRSFLPSLPHSHLYVNQL